MAKALRNLWSGLKAVVRGDNVAVAFDDAAVWLTDPARGGEVWRARWEEIQEIAIWRDHGVVQIGFRTEVGGGHFYFMLGHRGAYPLCRELNRRYRIVFRPWLAATRRADGENFATLWGTPARCPRCGYDLRGSTDRCPECGTEMKATGVVSPGLYIQTFGYCVVPDLLTPDQAAALAVELDGVQRAVGEANVRNLLRVAGVRELADRVAVREMVEQILGPGAKPVRGILFDKTPDANWNVLWHQDLSIAVKEKRDVPGYGPWSVKEGVVHVQPPVGVLGRMVTVRVNLDDCGPGSGPLKVLPSSHAEGVLDGRAIERWKARGNVATCTGGKGSAVVMRPLILHASGKATTPTRRRVVHIEFAAGELDGGLEWFEDGQ